jgi:hypothetical protein
MIILVSFIRTVHVIRTHSVVYIVPNVCNVSVVRIGMTLSKANVFVHSVHPVRGRDKGRCPEIDLRESRRGLVKK